MGAVSQQGYQPAKLHQICHKRHFQRKLTFCFITLHVNEGGVRAGGLLLPHKASLISYAGPVLVPALNSIFSLWRLLTPGVKVVFWAIRLAPA